ncbi:hemolysin activation/secretion protein [Methylohalomonas lacus]|uniref:Hemolysin activation/secretion protein n=1 Tax=Methylohalomonas lacus TaxID=398773 RepID=A0AAE3HN79_9GAMM|nr:ShlB/FhaC/HecB family hemolysin secretion/activation protein [Methylohalomonas lacus]MCS3904533.1 hemolysin activation/secretion protein [Methylohalomonas lacus]
MPDDSDIITGANPDRPGPVRPTREVTEEEGDRKQLLDELQGLVFVSSMDQVNEAGVSDVEGVEARTDDILTTPAFRDVVSEYLGQPVSLLSLKKLNRDVVSFYANNDYPVVDVVIPEQDITGGVVHLVVVKGQLGQVRAEGNEYFSDELLTSKIRTDEGEVLREKSILSNVRWMNRNPFRHTDLVYTRGQDQGETDVLLRTRDRFPLRVYTGYEDSGNRQTGEDRWIAGFNWGNVFGLDHQLNYQFTFNDNTNLFRAHSASYIIPLPWQHELSFFGSHADTRVKEGALGPNTQDLNLEGESSQISARYTIPLPEFKAFEGYTHEVALGYDYKTTNNNLEFGGFEVLDNDVDISQFVATYSASQPDQWGRTTLTTDFIHSPGGMMSNNEDENFQAFDDFADADYSYARLELQRIQKLPKDFSLFGRLTAQWSSDNLLGSEQLGGGGYRTVRGYEERVINGDEGYITNLELRSPSISLLKYAGHDTYNDQLQFLLFWDYASLAENEVAADQQKSYTISSVGPGLRYSIPPYLSVRLDYGWQLKDLDINNGVNRSRDSRVHLGVILSY